MNSVDNVLILGIGNPLRGDDGLGPALIETFERKYKENQFTSPSGRKIEFLWVYQLQIEAAEEWTHYTEVVVVDAHLNQADCIDFHRLNEDSSFSEIGSHSMTPSCILALAKECFAQIPPVYVLSLRGRQFEMGDPLSEIAKQSLNEATQFLVNRYFTDHQRVVDKSWS